MGQVDVRVLQSRLVAAAFLGLRQCPVTAGIVGQLDPPAHERQEGQPEYEDRCIGKQPAQRMIPRASPEPALPRTVKRKRTSVAFRVVETHSQRRTGYGRQETPATGVVFPFSRSLESISTRGQPALVVRAGNALA
jgi:hypothetical protein